MPLSMAASGETMVVTGMHGSIGMRKRMADLGLNIGMSITIVSAGYHSPLLVDLKGARYAIDHRLAQHVVVEPVRPA